MYRVGPDTLTEYTIPVLEADLPEPIFRDLFPVSFEELDPLSAPEPSEGALIKLENGEVILTVYGKKNRAPGYRGSQKPPDKNNYRSHSF